MRKVTIKSDEISEVYVDDEGNRTESPDTEYAQFLQNLVKYKQGEVDELDQNLMKTVMEDDVDPEVNAPRITYSAMFVCKVKNVITGGEWSEAADVAFLPLLFSLGYPDLIDKIMTPLLQASKEDTSEDAEPIELADAYDLMDLAVPNNNLDCIKYLTNAIPDLKPFLSQHKEELTRNANSYGAFEVSDYFASL